MKTTIENSIRNSIRPLILDKDFSKKTIIDVNVSIETVGTDWSDLYGDYLHEVEIITITLVLETKKAKKISLHTITIDDLQYLIKEK